MQDTPSTDSRGVLESCSYRNCNRPISYATACDRITSVSRQREPQQQQQRLRQQQRRPPAISCCSGVAPAAATNPCRSRAGCRHHVTRRVTRVASRHFRATTWRRAPRTGNRSAPRLRRSDRHSGSGGGDRRRSRSTERATRVGTLVADRRPELAVQSPDTTRTAAASTAWCWHRQMSLALALERRQREFRRSKSRGSQ